MRRSIIILIVALLIGLGAGVSSATCERSSCCEPVTYQCDGPPWSGGCDDYNCGELFHLGLLRGGWSDADLNLVVHSEGPVTLWLTWVSAEGFTQLGTVEQFLPAGNYERPFLSIVREAFGNRGDVQMGGLWLQWRSCGQSLLYLDGWNRRFISQRDGGYGQRSYLHNETICPSYAVDRSIGGVCGAGEVGEYFVDGCYELPVPPGTDYVRVQLMNQSSTDWQVVFVDGEEHYVPPLIPEVPTLLKFAFAPSSELVEICVGKENPWSGGLEIGDGCVLSSFEGISSKTKERLSLPLRPLIIIE